MREKPEAHPQSREEKAIDNQIREKAPHGGPVENMKVRVSNSPSEADEDCLDCWRKSEREAQLRKASERLSAPKGEVSLPT